MPQIPRNYWEIGPDGVPRMVMPKGPPGYKPRLKLPWEEEVDTPVAAQDPVMAKALRLIIEDEGEIEDLPYPAGTRGDPLTEGERWRESLTQTIDDTGLLGRVGNFAGSALGINYRAGRNPITGAENYDVTWSPGGPLVTAASAGAGVMVPGAAHLANKIGPTFGEDIDWSRQLGGPSGPAKPGMGITPDAPGGEGFEYANQRPSIMSQIGPALSGLGTLMGSVPMRARASVTEEPWSGAGSGGSNGGYEALARGIVDAIGGQRGTGREMGDGGGSIARGIVDAIGGQRGTGREMGDWGSEGLGDWGGLGGRW